MAWRAGGDWRLILCLALVVLPTACDVSSKSVARTRTFPLQRPAGTAPAGRDANDVGRFLAGLPGAKGSPFSEMERQQAWQTHRRELDQEWGVIQSGEIPAMSRFQSRELSGPQVGNSVVFYPFSGPDTLFPTVFFPRSPVYVLAGLEPPGTLPELGRLKAEDLSRFLEAVRQTVDSELRRSFFVTREMDREFRGQVSDGLLPTILHLLARTRHTITGYRYVVLDREGRIAARPKGERPPSKTGGNSGVEIEFRADGDQSMHTIFYFSTNLADNRLLENEAMTRFVSKLKGMTTYLKATSYMPHKQEFSIIRQLILNESAAILQDDSGIPYHFFGPAEWGIQLYGAYDRPYGSFRPLEQPDLKKAYETRIPKPLGFRIGYGFSRIPSNLQLAIRMDPKVNR